MADKYRLICEQISERPLYWQMSSIIGGHLQRPSGWCCAAVEELMSRVFLKKYRLVFVDMERSRLVDPGGKYDGSEVKHGNGTGIRGDHESQEVPLGGGPAQRGGAGDRGEHDAIPHHTGTSPGTGLHGEADTGGYQWD